MKKLFSTLTLIVLTSLLIAASPVGAPCEKVKGTGATFGTGPTSFAGTATFDDGRIADVSTNLLGPPRAGDDGTLHATTSHTFTFGDGSTFTTMDKAVLSPVEGPLYNLNTRATIITGTGAYKDACGSLSVHGTIDISTGTVVWRFNGQVCECR